MKHWTILTCRLAQSFLRHPRSLEVRAWDHKRIWNNEILRGVWVATLQILASWISWLYQLCRLKFEKCAHGAVSVPCEFLAAFHQIKISALIPNSWFRRFCRTRFQKGWAVAANMEDTVFAWTLSEKPGPSQLCLWPQQDTYGFGPRLRLGFKPPRECKCKIWKVEQRSF